MRIASVVVDTVVSIPVRDRVLAVVMSGTTGAARGGPSRRRAC
ncbi:hypothetical protein ACFPRL_28760 [Pseudoclavibacter helvolus]